MDAALLILLLLQLAPVFTKYVLVLERLTWEEARIYCMKNHIDLAVINGQQDLDLALEAIGENTNMIYIGLHRDPQSDTGWVWPSGEVVQEFFWQAKQPESSNQQYGAMAEGKWYDEYSMYPHPFLCSAVDLAAEMMTWEEALDHCKMTGKKLAIPRDDTELEQIGKELRKTNQVVWMGLHFFAGEWLWMDGQRADWYGLPLCPASGMGCGALRVEPSQMPQIFDSTPRQTDGGSYPGGSVDATLETYPESIPAVAYHWTDQHCNARLRFICN